MLLVWRSESESAVVDMFSLPLNDWRDEILIENEEDETLSEVSYCFIVSVRNYFWTPVFSQEGHKKFMLVCPSETSVVWDLPFNFFKFGTMILCQICRKNGKNRILGKILFCQKMRKMGQKWCFSPFLKHFVFSFSWK